MTEAAAPLPIMTPPVAPRRRPSGLAPSPTVRDAIARAAAATGVDFAYLMGQARVESGFNPAARARTSSATGLYQFIDQSWLGTLARHGEDAGYGWAASAITRAPGGRWRITDPDRARAIMDLRRDPHAAAAMAAGFASDNRQLLEARLGRRAEPVDLYLAHFLGPDGAARFLIAHDRDPDAPAAPGFRAAAAANRAIFHAPDGTPRSFGAIRQRFAMKLGVDAAPASGRPDAGVAPVVLAGATGPGTVQPADYLRLAGAIRTDGGDRAPARPASMPASSSDGLRLSGDGRRMLDPDRVRLAYVLLAQAGGGVLA